MAGVSRRDPWQATTLEWAMPMPPPPYNFASIPHIDTHGDRQAPGTVGPALARGEGYLGFTRHGWQETLGVHMTSGVPDQVIVLPRPTYLPLCLGLATATAVLGFLFKAYWLALSRAASWRRCSSMGRRARACSATSGRCPSAAV